MDVEVERGDTQTLLRMSSSIKTAAVSEMVHFFLTTAHYSGSLYSAPFAVSPFCTFQTPFMLEMWFPYCALNTDNVL